MVGPLILLLTTVIWGTGFLAQKLLVGILGTASIAVLRSVLGAVVLFLVIGIKRTPRDKIVAAFPAGAASGVLLFWAMYTQQLGLESTSPGVSAFLTTNYIFFVPLIDSLLRRRMPETAAFFGAAIALLGSFLLSMTGSEIGGFSLGIGERWTILCAVIFSAQMIVVDRWAPRVDVLSMSAFQLTVCALVGLPFMWLPSESSLLSMASIGRGIWPIIYLGVFSSGIAYTMQNIGQALTPPTLSAIILSLESVFGALSGWIALGEKLSLMQLSGCALIFAAIVFLQFITARKGVSGR